MNRILSLLLVTGGVLATACLGSPREEGSETCATRSFRLPLSSDQLVIELRSTGGLGRANQAIRLFGDGRLIEFELGAYPSQETLAELDLAGMEDLVRIAVDGGLFEASQEDLRRSDKVSIADAGQCTLVIHLADYVCAGESLGPRTTELKLESPTRVARYNPQNTHIVAYAAVAERLQRVRAGM